MTESGDPRQFRDLAILRLTGLFDRPAAPDLLAVLRQELAIPGLTEEIVGLNETEWNLALSDLEKLQLISKSEIRSSRKRDRCEALRISEFGFRIFRARIRWFGSILPSNCELTCPMPTARRTVDCSITSARTLRKAPSR